MIEFLQDYVTKSLPPEKFSDGEQVTRSNESELYLVRLGVAGYLIDGKLVDQDYQPIVRKAAVLVVATPDRRFADTGRGGEVIGLDAPQRATTGPGNAAVFGGQVDSTSLNGTEMAQLRGDLAASVAQYEDHRTTSAAQMDQITKDLTTAQGDRETALAAASTAQADAAQLRAELDAANVRLVGLDADLGTARQAASADAEKIAGLERDLAAATAKAAGKAK